MSIKELILGCKKGERTHFNYLYKMFSGSLFSICRRYAGNEEEAKDLLQEGFVKIFKKLDTFNIERGSFEGWMKRIVVNLCIDNYRNNKIRFQEVVVDDIADDSYSDSDDSAAEFQDIGHEEILQAITELPMGYRTVFNMYIIDEKSHKEIAATLNISENTSKTQLFKARKMLQKKLRSEMISGSK